MSFFILSASNNDYRLDQSIVKGIVAGDLGKPAISVASQYLSYSDKVLSIQTEITFGGLTPNAFHEGVHASYHSNFEIDPDFLVAEANSDAAMSVLKKCHELAQAHAYSIYLLQCGEHSVPQTGMDRTPVLKFDYKADNFLQEIKSNHNDQ